MQITKKYFHQASPKKKKNNHQTHKTSDGKISSWCNCSSTFPFSFHQTTFCLCSGHGHQGFPPRSPATGLCFLKHLPLCLEKWGTLSPTSSAPQVQPLHLHSLLPWHEPGPRRQAAHPQLVPLHPSIWHRFSCNHPGTGTWHHGVMFHSCSMHVV